MKAFFNISIVIGTRPEAIKLAPLILEFKKHSKFRIRTILSGQHKEMVSQVMELFNLNSDNNLKIMKENQSLNYVTSSILNKLEIEFNQFKPDLVIVQGDTTTAMAASLAAFYNQLPVAHVEAGLRTNDIYNPFPEEINRRLISQIATLHFAPTSRSMENLISSKIKKNVYKTGNTVIDALLIASKKELQCPFVIDKSIPNQKIILATVHRRENWGSNLEKIVIALKKILDNDKSTQLIFPMHKNQNIRKTINKYLENHSRAILCEPLDYSQLVGVMNKSFIVLTDSGGLQEEAPTLGKPILILRETTERPEVIECGAAKLVGSNTENIFSNAMSLIQNKKLYKSMSEVKNPFGDGKASYRIVEQCFKFLKDF